MVHPKRPFKSLLFVGLISSLPTIAGAKGAGTSGGTAFLDHGSARAAGLAEAYSAGTNDITAFQFNPASLNTLESSEASFYFQKGLEDDSQGRLHFGTPINKVALGLSVGYYNAGTFEMSDGVTTRSVTSQRDLTLMLGAATGKGPLSMGGALKYLSSELIESKSASTFAVDAGIQFKLNQRLELAGAVQNFGPGLKYESETDPLPRLVRGGLKLDIPRSAGANAIYLDLPYYLNEQELQPGGGIEVGLGALILRGGLARRSRGTEYTVGTGFSLGHYSLDYGMAMISNLDARHQINLAIKFGDK